MSHDMMIMIHDNVLVSNVESVEYEEGTSRVRGEYTVYSISISI